MQQTTPLRPASKGIPGTSVFRHTYAHMHRMYMQLYIHQHFLRTQSVLQVSGADCDCELQIDMGTGMRLAKRKNRTVGNLNKMQ